MVIWYFRREIPYWYLRGGNWYWFAAVIITRACSGNILVLSGREITYSMYIRTDTIAFIGLWPLCHHACLSWNSN